MPDKTAEVRALDRTRLRKLMAREEARFSAERPKSLELFGRAKASLLGGVPMNWMTKWPGGFPPFIVSANGAELIDADGHTYVDLCLGDTGAMAGHAPPATVERISAQAALGITHMLPTKDVLCVGEELGRRFGLRYWQFTLTATDANRFAVRLARQVTGRPKILVFNWCYHGSVDETLATLDDGAVGPRRGNTGPPVDPAETTKVVEFNDLEALEAALAPGDVACVLAEPALTNIGIVHPEPGFHDALRELTRRHGTWLIIDETHTICAGPGGYTKAFGLEPDVLTIGKTIGSGVPAATYGFSEEIAECVLARASIEDADVSGIGGTLAGNALSIAAIRATLEHVLTEEAFERMITLAERFTEGVEQTFAAYGVPWHVTRLGCRAEYLFTPTRPRNGAEAASAGDYELDRFVHLYVLNRGILLTPFHNMALMSPATTQAHVDRHTDVLKEAVADLFG